MSLRSPRFHRSEQVAPMQLCKRDHEVIRLVEQHRFLRSSHLCALLPGSKQQLLRRLRLLYHHGYLERPRSQIDYYHNGGSREIVYGLGNKGGSLMRQLYGAQFPQLRWGEKNRAVVRMFLEHALLVSDIMVALELACRERGLRLHTEGELAQNSFLRFAWNVKVSNGLKLGVVPDRVFAMDYPDENGKLNRAYFFLEADRGTMPVIRKNFYQTSFYRKLLGYRATWLQSIHHRRFGFNRFRVVTVTTSAARLKSLLKACSKLESGHGLFLFSDTSILKDAATILSPAWHRSQSRELATLLE